MIDLKEFKEITLDWRVPVLVTAIYIIYVKRQNKIFESVPPYVRPRYSPLTFFMVIHNLILCLFSIICFVKSFPIVYYHYKTKTLFEFMADQDHTMRTDLNHWFWIFYLSKYYEIVDTIILHLNRRKTSFLQMYHHAGAIICCWMLASCHNHLSWIFVVLNSFVHSIMYFYYSLTCIGIKSKYKYLITQMQMAQFILGCCILVLHLFVDEIWSEDKYLKIFQISAFVSNLLYVSILYVLFSKFSRDTYGAKRGNANKLKKM
ncbi:Elongation of fatty acids protein sre1 [Astathelohania contejeani]|uniref:Elongation of fatty acids protein n=1 Tax=Astathelohania contejeani TaxID=164912 RepID=A0ABQ7I115_9MICR|nr:Elongation of fatty acids protein sre1 [Thelohania contejeani]